MNFIIAQECSELSEQEKISFPEVVARLNAAGIDSYYADLLAASTTYYSGSEAYQVSRSKKTWLANHENFNSEKIIQALRSTQSGQIQYQEFIRQIMEAGVICYFVFLKGLKAVYIGRQGEEYVETFPSKINIRK